MPLIYDVDESDKRELFMPPALVETLRQVHPKQAREYAANIRGFLGVYVKGKPVDNRDYMKSWKDDVFELRVQNQKPGHRLRIFGAFGRPDTFVAFFRKSRNHFDGKDDPSGSNLTLGARATALNPAEIGHCCRTQANDFHH